MDKVYPIGQNLSYIDREYSDIKNALKQNNIIPQTTPSDKVVSALNNAFTDVQPENIKYNTTIMGVTGTLRNSVDDWTLEELFNVPVINYSYTTQNHTYTYYHIKDESNLYCVDNNTKEVTLIADDCAGVRALYEIKNNDVYIAYYDTLDNSILLYASGAYSKRVYVDARANFKQSAINFFESDLGYCYFASGQSGSYSTYTGIHYLEKDSWAVQIVGSSTYTSTNGYQWYFPFEDSKHNVYATAYSGTSTLYALQKNTVITVTGANSYLFDNWFEMSNGDLYCYSGYNLVALCYVDNINFTITNFCYGRNWTIVEDKNGNIYGASTSSSSSDYGIVLLNKAEETRIFDKHKQWKLLKDAYGNVYGMAGYLSSGYDSKEKSTIYSITPQGVEPIASLNITSSIKTFNDNIGTLYLTSKAGAKVLENNTLKSAPFSCTYELSVVCEHEGYTYVHAGSYDRLYILHNGQCLNPSGTILDVKSHIIHGSYVYLTGFDDGVDRYKIYSAHKGVLKHIFTGGGTTIYFSNVYTNDDTVYFTDDIVTKRTSYDPKDTHYALKDGEVYCYTPNEVN